MNDAEELEGAGILQLMLVGKTYTHQSGGYACKHPTARGKIREEFPSWPDHWISDALADYFTGEKWGGWCDRGIEEADAVVIDSLLTVAGKGEWKVDRDMLKESMEAWVYLKNDEIGLDGILFWENSD